METLSHRTEESVIRGSWMRRSNLRAGAHGLEIGVRAPVKGHGCVFRSQSGAKGRAVCAVIVHHQLLVLPAARQIEVTTMFAEIDGLPFIEAKSHHASFGGAPAVIDCAGQPQAFNRARCRTKPAVT